MNNSSKRLLIHFAIALALAIAIFCLVFFLRGYYTLSGASDACFAAGAGLALVPFLILIYRTGLFDIANYGFLTWLNSFKANSPKPYESAGAYSEKKKYLRSQSHPLLWPYIVIGVLSLALALIFLLVWLNASKA
jgi:hypothetical protein